MAHHMVLRTDEERMLVQKIENGQTLTFLERKKLRQLVNARQPKEYYSLQQERIEKTRKQGFVIDTIWPRAGFHALVGSSGVGKSTWLLQAIHDWEKGLPVLGFKSYPAPYVYIMCDRAQTELQDSLDRMGLGNWDIKGYSIEQLSSAPFEVHPDNLDIQDLITIFPWAQVFFIEGYTYWYKNKSSNATKDYTDTLRFWGNVRNHFAEKGKTIIGTGHQPKNKPEGVTKTRDKIFGSVGQGAVMGTVMVMEDDARNRKVRNLAIAPRNAREFTVVYDVGAMGELIFNRIRDEDEKESKTDEKEDSGATLQLNKKLQATASDDILPSSTIVGWANEIGVTRKTAQRWVTAQLESGYLTKLQKGLFKKGKLQ